MTRQIVALVQPGDSENTGCFNALEVDTRLYRVRSAGAKTGTEGLKAPLYRAQEVT